MKAEKTPLSLSPPPPHSAYMYLSLHKTSIDVSIDGLQVARNNSIADRTRWRRRHIWRTTIITWRRVRQNDQLIQTGKQSTMGLINQDSPPPPPKKKEKKSHTCTHLHYLQNLWLTVQGKRPLTEFSSACWAPVQTNGQEQLDTAYGIHTVISR